MCREFHFIHGASAGAALKRAIGDAEVIVMDDWLSLGPLKPFSDPQEWDKSRSAFWKEHFGPLDAGDIRDFSKLMTYQDKIMKGAKIVLWVGSSLREQLFFVWIVSALQKISIESRNILFIPASNSFPAAYNLGVLSPENFLQIREEARELFDVSLIWETWQCICSNIPKWTLCAHGVSSQYPLLAERLKLMKLHFPSVRNGLDVWDYRLLRTVESFGPRSIDIISEMFSVYRNEPDILSDLLLGARIIQLSNKNRAYPLLSIEGKLPLRTLNVRLTESGTRVLRNDLNNVTLNGIDDWVAGVHLQSPLSSIWYYDPDKDELVLQ